jgi:uncharacterized protein
MRQPEDAVARAAVALGRAVRAEGLLAPVDAELTLTRALGEIELDRRDHVYWASRACFVHARDDVPRFDRVFDRFWGGLALDDRPTAVAEHAASDPRMPGPQHGGESLPRFRRESRSAHLLDGNTTAASRDSETPTAPAEETGDGRRRGVLAAYSPVEVLPEREPLGFDPAELAAIRRLGEQLRTVAPLRRSRRLRGSRHGGRLDLHRTLARSLETQGEPLCLEYAARAETRRRIVLLCDVSGSMERYARALLGSLQAAIGVGSNVEAFVFATRLTRLTKTLGGRDVSHALEAARDSVLDWSGGTRIGEALAEFRRTYGPRGMARGAIFIVVSDGWDRGDPDQLAAELEHLRLECRRLIWLNPRPSLLDGQPLAVGMRAALPYVDDFVPGHDPRAMDRLVRLVAGLGTRRPPRRQRVGLRA